ISPDFSIPISVTDLGGHLHDEREAEARRLAVLEAQTPFDLEHGPLVRARILRLDDREHVALLAIHHIVTDGWSMGVAARELAALYEAYPEGCPSPLSELPIQYADFAAWQRRSLEGEALDRLLAYWSRHLEGMAPLELPTDRARPAVRSSRG